MAALLLLLPTSTYRTHDLMRAAQRLDVELIVGSERQQVLEPQTDDTTVTLPLSDTDAAVAVITELAGRRSLDAIVGLDDGTTAIAAAAAANLGLRHAAPGAVAALNDKALLRGTQRAAGLPCPAFRVLRTDADTAAEARTADYPCVLKPTFLSASRGVIRADDPSQFAAAFRRIRDLLAQPELRRQGGDQARQILVEDYVPGPEVAFEGVLDAGRLQPLAVFDKPDPLEGPYFEETIYVTPSRLPPASQDAVRDAVAELAAAAGLHDGPVHAELRLPPTAPVVIEMAPRTIGGLCSRVLHFGAGVSLEELILRQALGDRVGPLRRQAGAAGVMMIPIPHGGRLQGVEGLHAARRIDGIDAIEITIRRGQHIVPLPEGNRYLGFIFGHADTPGQVEASLRRAHALLRFVIE